MIFSDAHKFIFVHIPKTGGTSIKRALYDFYNPDQIEFDGEKVTDIDSYRPHTAMTTEVSAQYPDYFKFAIIRNPWSWHASIWKFFQRPDRNNKTITGISFDAYLEEVCCPETKLPYRRNVADWIYEGDDMLVDFVGRFERLAEDFDTILARIGLDKSQVNLPHFKNAGPYDYASMYSPAYVDMIAKKHARDIALFGYQFDEAEEGKP